MGRVVSLWSGPRNRSTALMYSVAQREGVQVVDEPLFGHYLALTGARRPSRDEVLAVQETDPAALLPVLQPRTEDRFLKHMACHLRGWAPEVFADHVHVLLIRDPAAVVASYRKGVLRPTLEDLGCAWQAHWWRVCRSAGWPVHVLDSDRLVEAPEEGLKALCRACGWEWDERMLRWEPGPRPEDGVWAKRWYGGVHASSGWAANRAPQPAVELSETERALVRACREHHDALQQHAMN